jgi:hypothetical protein
MNPRMLFMIVAMVLAIGGSAASFADDVASPTTTTTTPGGNLGPRTTYQSWDRFSSATSANTPDAGLFNPNGTPQLVNVEPTAFITSTRNIYSHQAPIHVTVDVPNYGAREATWTSLFVDISTLGQPFDPGAVSVGGYAPVSSSLAASSAANSPYGGMAQSWTLQFQIPGNDGNYALNVPAPSPFISLDALSVSTIYTTGASPVSQLPASFPHLTDVPGQPPAGDMNFDHTVDRGDLANLVRNLGTTSHASYADGDLDLDGAVGLADLRLLQANLGTTTNFGVGSPAAVPEPATWTIVVGSLLGLMAVGRRRLANKTT